MPIPPAILLTAHGPAYARGVTTVPAPEPARPPIGAPDLRAAGAYVLTVLVLAVVGLRNLPFLRAEDPWPLGLSLTLLLVAAVSTLWRRRAPVVTLLVVSPLAVAELLGGGQVSAYALLFEALWCPVVHGSARLAHATTLVAATVGAVLVVGATAVTGSLTGLLAVALVLTVVVLVPLLWGWEVRHHREARASAETLARLEHELAAERAALAVESERRRIAHDLHDVVAGHLSAVSLHTSLAADLEEESARRRSLDTARDSARAALRDLRGMIGLLTGDEGAAPTVTLSWVVLGERLRDLDPGARVAVDPALTDPGTVAPAVRAALLRIGAEAVTNAVRHGAAPAQLEVTLQKEEVLLVLENALRDEAATGASDGAGPGTGVGRGAIAARAAAVGGSAHSGPTSSVPPLWRVEARLPARRPDPAPAPSAPARPARTSPEVRR